VASYSVLIKASAGKELAGIGQKKDRVRIVRSIGMLAADPRPERCEKLSGPFDLYPIRVGSHRVIYSVDDSAGEVHVVKIGHRKDVYR
jgi:mRNA interferase RelE/StbE